MNVSGYIYESVCDGEGLRNVIFISGCKHKCEGCFNKQTWDFNHGHSLTMDEFKVFCNKSKHVAIEGITLSGGDPMYSYKELIPYLEYYKEEVGKTIWMYTGFKWEEIMDSDMKDILPYIDVIVDGQYRAGCKLLIYELRGSSNQRIIDVKESLNTNKIVLWKGCSYNE